MFCSEFSDDPDAKYIQSASTRDESVYGDFVVGFSCSSGNRSLSLQQCICKGHSVITSCSAVTQHRSEDKQRGSSGDGFLETSRAGQLSDLAFNILSDCQYPLTYSYAVFFIT